MPGLNPLENTARVDDAVLERADLDCVKSPKSTAFPNDAIDFGDLSANGSDGYGWAAGASNGHGGLG